MMSDAPVQDGNSTVHVTQKTPSHLSADSLFSIDQFEALISNTDHDEHTLQIVDALGGIDKILNEYIRVTRVHDEEQLLDDMAMQQIASIISLNEEPLSVYEKVYARAQLKGDTFHLSRSDTLLHSIGCNHCLVDKLMSFLLSKYVLICTWAAAAVWVPLVALYGAVHAGNRESLWLFLMQFILLCVYIIYWLLVILCCNVSVFQMVLLSFDFWIKVLYSVSLAVAEALYQRQFEYEPETQYIQYMYSVIRLCIVIAVSLIEGYRVSWGIKFGMALCMSAIYSYWALYYTLYHDGEELSVLISSGVSVELLAWIGSAYRIVSLFLWKQALMAAYTRGEWCICIYLSPYLQWNDGDGAQEESVDATAETIKANP